ncbi:TVP38/TMEM64 family protein [Patescibacteria group bacterium]|nr:TVP38/TMEM64 family protein [Patescibacteria group bacterium]
MSWIKTEYIKHHKIKVAAYSLVFAFLVWAVFYFGELIKSVFTSSDAIREWVLQYGAFAPLALFLLQVAQVIVAPLNNFLINFAGGYIFGPYMGFVYNYFGWVLGAIIVFWLARYFGRRFVNLFISEEKLARFDKIVGQGIYIIFFLLLLPGAPDDFLVYVMALSKSIKFKTFLWMILIGKIPGKIATSFLGAGVAEHSMLSVALYALFILVSVAVFLKKPELWRLGKEDLQ